MLPAFGALQGREIDLPAALIIQLATYYTQIEPSESASVSAGVSRELDLLPVSRNLTES